MGNKKEHTNVETAFRDWLRKENGQWKKYLSTAAQVSWESG